MCICACASATCFQTQCLTDMFDAKPDTATTLKYNVRMYHLQRVFSLAKCFKATVFVMQHQTCPRHPTTCPYVRSIAMPSFVCACVIDMCESPIMCTSTKYVSMMCVLVYVDRVSAIKISYLIVSFQHRGPGGGVGAVSPEPPTAPRRASPSSPTPALFPLCRARRTLATLSLPLSTRQACERRPPNRPSGRREADAFVAPPFPQASSIALPLSSLSSLFPLLSLHPCKPPPSPLPRPPRAAMPTSLRAPHHAARRPDLGPPRRPPTPPPHARHPRPAAAPHAPNASTGWRRRRRRMR